MSAPSRHVVEVSASPLTAADLDAAAASQSDAAREVYGLACPTCPPAPPVVVGYQPRTTLLYVRCSACNILIVRILVAPGPTA